VTNTDVEKMIETVLSNTPQEEQAQYHFREANGREFHVIAEYHGSPMSQRVYDENVAEKVLDFS
jgi:hypothetical protein